MGIDFTLSKEQAALRDGARAFASTVLKDVRKTIRQFNKPDERFYATRPFHRKAVEAGFVKGLFPKEVGGTDVPALDFAIAAEELAAVDVNVPSTLLGTGLCVKPIVFFGIDEQKKRFLPDFIDDGTRLGALAFTEVTGGANYDAADPRFGMKTFATLEGNEWVINGEKHYTTNGTGWDGKNCHLYAVVCRTDPNKSAQESLAVIMVPGNLPGVKVTGILDTVGNRATISPRMKFENVRVPRRQHHRQAGRRDQDRIHQLRLDCCADRRSLCWRDANRFRPRPRFCEEGFPLLAAPDHRLSDRWLHVGRHEDENRGLPISDLEILPTV
jgi:nitroalkane oxidase